jgi:hypothetical protein
MNKRKDVGEIGSILLLCGCALLAAIARSHSEARFWLAAFCAVTLPVGLVLKLMQLKNLCLQDVQTTEEHDATVYHA